VDAGDGEDEPLLGSPTLRPPTKAAGSFEDVQPGASVEITFGALDGAKLSLLARPEKKSGSSLAVMTLISPSGAAVSLDGVATKKGTAASLATKLHESGTWRVRLSATGGSPGKVTYAIKLTEPKGVTFSAD
jgi:hypothetical protein